MAESVDASDLKSDKPKGLCGFNSRSEYGKAAVGLTIDSRFSSTRCLAWGTDPGHPNRTILVRPALLTDVANQAIAAGQIKKQILPL